MLMMLVVDPALLDKIRFLKIGIYNLYKIPFYCLLVLENIYLILFFVVFFCEFIPKIGERNRRNQTNFCNCVS